jgi:hypothetical protein
METMVVFQKKKKTRRSLRINMPKQFEKKFILIGVNAAGLATKLKSLDFDGSNKKNKEARKGKGTGINYGHY